MVFSTIGVLEAKSISFLNGKTTFEYDVVDPIDFLDDDDYEDFKNCEIEIEE